MADDQSRLWTSLGALVAKRLASKVSTKVPGLGTFTFSQDRQPIFFGTDEKSAADVMTWSEIASRAAVSEDAAQRGLTQQIRDLKEKVRGEAEYRRVLPSVGEFIGRDGLLVLVFDQGPRSRPKTAGSSVSVAPDGAEWLRTNLNLELTQPALKPPLAGSTSLGSLHNTIGSPVAFLLQNQAKLLLALQKTDKTGNGLLTFSGVVEGFGMLENPMITETVIRNLVQSTGSETNGMINYRQLVTGLSMFRIKRVSSAATSHRSGRSDATVNYPRTALMPFIRKIWEKKLIITEFSQKGGMRPRVKTTSSELLAVLKKSGLKVNLHQLHAVLREVNLDPISVSILDLIEAVRRFLQPEESDLSVFTEAMSQPSDLRPQTPVQPEPHLAKVRHYFETHPMEPVLERCIGSDDMVTVESFVEAMTVVGKGMVRAIEAQTAFLKATDGRVAISAGEWIGIFQPQGGAKAVSDRGFRVLREWLRRDKLTSEQAFDIFLKNSGSQSQVLTRDQFFQALSDFSLNSLEAELLFQALDSKHDAVIDLGEWCNKIYEEYGPYQALRDVVIGNHVQTEDLLIRMNIRDKQRLTTEDLARVLQAMDPTLTSMKAVEIATTATKKRGYVDVQDFLLQLSQEPIPYEGDWKEHIYSKIKQKMNGNPKALKTYFEAMDTRSIGKLGLADFQDCVYKANLGLDPVEIERLARILDKRESHMIDYNDFLAHLTGPNLPPPDPLKLACSRLIIFLNQNAMTPAQLLKRFGGKVALPTFAAFLSAKVQKHLTETLALEVAMKMDLNQDGFIDLQDLTAVLTNRMRVTLSQNSTFPTERLEKEKAKEVFRAIKQALVYKRVNFADAFRTLDRRQNGMLTAEDWSQGLEQYIELSQPIKDGLFAILDAKGIGLVDYATFLKVMKDGDMDTSLGKDSWATEDQILDRIRQWIRTENISIEAAFRAFDRDFDGVLSKNDLRESLISVLKMEEGQLPSSKLDRLYKLMDTYKRDNVQLADFKLLFEENSVPEWKQSAKQQLGVFISKQFPDITASFESVSQLAGKLTFDQFRNWVTEHNALAGFNLTNDLLQQLYADIDWHRKGFLTLQDWKQSFEGYQWQDQIMKELKDAVRANFADIRTAFDFFASFQVEGNNEYISKAEFERGIKALIPSRFQSADVNFMWKSLNSSREHMHFSDFKSAFGDTKFISTFSRSSRRSQSSRPVSMSRPKTAPSIGSGSRFSSALFMQGEDPLKRLFSVLETSAINLETIFSQIDADGSGKISSLEFRNAMRKLNLGLTARDIDQLLLRIDTNNDGQIDWQEFKARFKSSETEARIRRVAEQRVARLREHMFAYMLSPNDAFRQFDPSRRGQMTFSDFNALMKRISQLSGDPLPAFTVLKDLFDFVDARQDGYLDRKEWASAFKVSEMTTNWEDTQDFDKVCAAVGRNRKLILLAFEAMSRDSKVTYEKAKEVLSMALRDYRLSEEQWRKLLRVADRGGMVDYRFLLDIYKERATLKVLHPRPVMPVA